jgi:hypothetical protein
LSDVSDSADGDDVGTSSSGSRAQNHSFILRIRSENTSQAKKRNVWRGSIEHVGSGQRFFFQDLESILDFILEQIHSSDHSVK